jgi:hypothetical protein
MPGQTVNFSFVTSKIIIFTLLSAISSLVLFATAAALSSTSLGSFRLLALWFGGAFLAVYALDWGRFLFVRGYAISITDEGIKDQRISADLISWGDVEELAVLRFRYSKWVVLRLRPGARNKLKRSCWRQIVDAANAVFFLKNVYIYMAGLDGTFEDLVAGINRIAPPELNRIP